MALETFPPMSNAQCCGTCRHWKMRIRGKPVKYCPVIDAELPGLTTCGCALWIQERHERFARALYQEIEEATHAEG